jgi:amino acid permease
VSQDACLRVVKMGSDNFVKTMTHNIPKMMFVFLPLMAGVMALLYWHPRRYYVEHLVFLLHNHSALFLGFVAQTLVETLAHYWHPLAAIGSITELLLFLWVLWYPYAAMRRYYAQGRALTAVKYVFIGLAYGVCLVITFIGTAVITVQE